MVLLIGICKSIIISAKESNLDSYIDSSFVCKNKKKNTIANENSKDEYHFPKCKVLIDHKTQLGSSK